MPSVEHVVFFKLKDISEEQERSLKEQVEQLVNKIDGVLSIVFGRNISPERSQGYTHALRATFQSKEIIKIYAEHPEHVKVATQLKSLAEAPAICLDWEH
ncbi:hypothetical protein ABK040_008394 [Willaertia magna]